MPISARTSIVFNIAAGIVGVAAVVGAVRYTVFKPQIEPCDRRYRSVMHFTLEKNGQLVTPDELQARAGGQDKGMHNVEVQRLAQAPKPVVMKVALASGAGGPDAGSRAGGMHFPWTPRAVASHGATCLAYNLMLAPDFETSGNGLLPGLSGGHPTDDERFEVHLAWDQNGEGNVRSRVITKPIPEASSAALIPAKAAEAFAGDVRFMPEMTAFELPKGRWVRVAQELVLNKPEETDGVLRFWIDGKLVFERTDMRLRTTAETQLRGVAAAVHLLGGPDVTYAGRTDGIVSLTPFELYW